MRAFFFRLAVAAFVAGACLSAAPRSWAAAPGLSSIASDPSARGGLPERHALIVAPRPEAHGGRARLSHGDEVALRRLLVDLGFSVSTIGPSSRPEIDLHVRSASARIGVGAEIVLIVLGRSIGADRDLLIPVSDVADPGAVPAQAGLDAHAVRLSAVLRRLASVQPRALVAIVDECVPHDAQGGDCDISQSISTSGASVMSGVRRVGSTSGRPQLGLASLRQALTGPMQAEGSNLFQFFNQVQQDLRASDMGLVSAGALSSSFFFVPPGHYASLRNDCNAFALDASPAALRTANLQPAFQSCIAATARWPEAARFAERYRLAREQIAFQSAVAGCVEASAAAYRSQYPAGRYIAAVNEHMAGCARIEQERRDREERARREADERNRRQPAASVTGWSLQFSPQLLFVSPDASDSHDPRRESYNTVWHSRAHGQDVVLYLQVSPNVDCRSPRQYLGEVVGRNRRATEPPFSATPASQPDWEGFAMFGQGFVSGRNVLDRQTVDIVWARRSDRSTIVHLGGRFPRHLADTYGQEVVTMLESLRLPQGNPFAGRCR